MNCQSQVRITSFKSTLLDTYDQLEFVEFLEFLVRVADVYPESKIVVNHQNFH